MLSFFFFQLLLPFKPQLSKSATATPLLPAAGVCCSNKKINQYNHRPECSLLDNLVKIPPLCVFSYREARSRETAFFTLHKNRLRHGQVSREGLTCIIHDHEDTTHKDPTRHVKKTRHNLVSARAV
ncbi:uncharacterized protein LOC143267475 [Peromyscus maniculatus bairdii]|uniref:uncharacterized protein LOC143267475 n=1 Tax=Peromyscus maniculatus bairdii TaxID=230844 RepID=UPI003FD3433F